MVLQENQASHNGWINFHHNEKGPGNRAFFIYFFGGGGGAGAAAALGLGLDFLITMLSPTARFPLS